jgi:hypothetical protein
MTSLATENLHLAAFEICEGASLKAVQISRSNGQMTALFELKGPAVQRTADAFYAGPPRSTVNPGEYRRHLEALKDELFGALRRAEKEGRG